MAINAQDKYFTQQVMSASPEQLTMLLYEGALRFVKQSIRACEEKNFEESHQYNLKTQAIIQELYVTLDYQFEISESLGKLYDFVIYLLIEGNIKKDEEQLRQAEQFIKEFRDTWKELLTLAAEQKKAGKITDGL